MISIVTPTYNSGEYLEECIRSILGQDFQDYEHIIVDGASTDHTLQIIKKYENKYNMRWISEKDGGMYDAIRKGFAMAEGNILCWLNSDDMYMPWTLKLVSRVMEDRRVQWCTGIPSHFAENGINYIGCRRVPGYPRRLIKKGWMDGRRLGAIQQESTFWTRELYIKSGGLNTGYQYAGDYYLWKSFAAHEKLYVVNSVLAGFRIHAGQKSEDKDAYYGEIGPVGKEVALLSGLKFFPMLRRLYHKSEGNTLLNAGEIIQRTKEWD